MQAKLSGKFMIHAAARFSSGGVEGTHYMTHMTSVRYPKPVLTVNVVASNAEHVQTRGQVVEVTGDIQNGTRGAWLNVLAGDIAVAGVGDELDSEAVLSIAGRVYKKTADEDGEEPCLWISVDEEADAPRLFGYVIQVEIHRTLLTFVTVRITRSCLEPGQFSLLHEGHAVDVDCAFEGLRFRTDGSGPLPLLRPISPTTLVNLGGFNPFDPRSPVSSTPPQHRFDDDDDAFRYRALCKPDSALHHVLPKVGLKSKLPKGGATARRPLTASPSAPRMSSSRRAVIKTPAGTHAAPRAGLPTPPTSPERFKRTRSQVFPPDDQSDEESSIPLRVKRRARYSGA